MSSNYPSPGTSLDDIVTFAEVARRGSLRQAGERLHLTTGAVSRRLDALEQRLGVRLLHRTTRSVSLTTAGSEYLADVLPAVEAISIASQRLSEHEGALSGEIRISLPVNYGRLHIAPCLPEFLNLHPNVSLDAVFNDSFSDIVGDGFDLAIRIGHLEDSRLVARRIATDQRIIAASPEYLDVHGIPRHPTDLLHHDCLHYTHFRGSQRWIFRKDGEQLSIPINGRFRANYGHALTLAAEQGLGIVQSSRAIIFDALKAGNLCEILTDWVLPEIGVYAVTPSRNGMPLRVQVLIDFLSQRLPDA
uniref:LysR family transcriptional regulator n=1 Tax=Halomonas sp. TaxID=1486246 RepID=UPI00260EBD93|nr:LysR family transcriptional regulator [Halomonas sp.]